MGEADASIEHAQIVVNLGDCADGRARIARGRLLLDGDGRRETADVVHLGLLILAQKLPRVAGQRFDVAPLSLRVQRVERQARLAGAADTRQDDKLIARYLDGDVLEVVLSRTTNDDLLWSHRLGCTFSEDARRQAAAAARRPNSRSTRSGSDNGAGGIRLLRLRPVGRVGGSCACSSTQKATLVR